MNEPTAPPDLLTLDGRRAATRFDLSDDATSYTCVRVFGAPPERVYRAFTRSRRSPSLVPERSTAWIADDALRV